jgi:gluconate 2-dehydrogenase gamma chain
MGASTPADGSTPPELPGDDTVSHTRRNLLAASLALPLSGAIGAATITGAMPWHEGQAANPRAAERQFSATPYSYLTPAEAAFVEAAVARLIPSDESGPGAVEAGVPLFIDRQLGGEYGLGSRWYMQGPWAKGEFTQGYQARMPPGPLYKAAIREIDGAVTRETGGLFAKLAGTDQDAWLHRLEDGKLELPTVDAKAFFKVLWQNTLEGFWSDPIYGGNIEMVGWKLIGFPGARYDYSDYVTRHGERYPLPPVGLKGRSDTGAGS